MNFNCPLPRATQPGFGEGSGLRSTRDSDALAQLPKKTNTNVQQDIRNGEAIRRLTRAVQKLQKRPGGGMVGGGGLQFQQPYIELDPTIGVPQWTIVNVSPTNPMTSLVTALFDLVSGNQTVAPTGYWVACDDIPAQVVNPTGKPAGTYYNVPVMPPSVAWVSSPGSQKGDLDQAGILWLPLPRTGACV